MTVMRPEGELRRETNLNVENQPFRILLCRWGWLASYKEAGWQVKVLKLLGRQYIINENHYQLQIRLN